MVTKPSSNPIIVWFRHDLRVADHPALTHAARLGRVIPVYVLDRSSRWSPGGASRWWLHHSLASLERDLGGLVLLQGNAAERLLELAQRLNAQSVLWNRHYDPDGRRNECELSTALSRSGIAYQSFPGSLLWEPGQVKTLDGKPFKVFTPFWRACQKTPVAEVLAAPKLSLDSLVGLGETLQDWQLLPSAPDWAEGLRQRWTPGEAGAWKRFSPFPEEESAGLRGTTQPSCGGGYIAPVAASALWRNLAAAGLGRGAGTGGAG